MLKITKRWALLAILGAVFSSAVLSGCGGSNEDETATNTATPAAKDGDDD